MSGLKRKRLAMGVFNNMEVATIATDVKRRSEKKGTMIKFDVVSRAMKAKKSANKCAVRPELLFCLLSSRSASLLPEIAGSTRKQFGFSTKSLQCDDFVKKPSI